MLTCREFVAGLSDLLCGDLARARKRESKRHLARCQACASYWRSYRTTVALEREAYAGPDGADRMEMPADLVASILAAARALRSGSSRPVWHLVHLLSGIAAAPLLAFYLR